MSSSAGDIAFDDLTGVESSGSDGDGGSMATEAAALLTNGPSTLVEALAAPAALFDSLD